MDIQTRKISFIQEFLRIQNEEIISSLEKLLKVRKSEFFAKENIPMDLEQFNKEIDQAIIDSENDNVIKATDLKAKF
jgi:hypothetical protein